MLHLCAVIAFAGLSPSVLLSCNIFLYYTLIKTILILIESSDDLILVAYSRWLLFLAIATKKRVDKVHFSIESLTDNWSTPGFSLLSISRSLTNLSALDTREITVQLQQAFFCTGKMATGIFLSRSSRKDTSKLKWLVSLSNTDKSLNFVYIQSKQYILQQFYR